MSSHLFPRLFAPLQVGPMHVPNRLCETANTIGAGRRDGLPDDAFIEHHVAKARGGIGWIGNEVWLLDSPLPRHVSAEVTPAGASTSAAVHARPDFVQRVGRFCDAVHDAGAVAVFQLAHVSAQLGPSPVPVSDARDLVPHELEETEIAQLIGSYAQAAEQFARAGADGVEIHAVHESLAHLFLSPATNRRQDRWGGCVEGRAAFVIEILRGVRERVGRRTAIGVRLSLGERRVGGFDSAEALELAGLIVAAALPDYVSVDGGHSWGDPSYVPPAGLPVALGASAAREMRAVLHSVTPVPLVYAGRVFDPHVAEELLASGVCDLVGVTRASIADSEFGVKSRDGRLDEIRWCIGCNRCIDNAEHGHGTGLAAKGSRAICSVNPVVGNEVRWRERFAVTCRPRRVVVVGAGPAGLEVARVARLRGHDVVVLERERHVGGQVRLAAAAPGLDQFGNFLEYMTAELARLGVELRLGVAAEPEGVLALSPDVAVCATGSRPRPPSGAATDAFVYGRDVLAGTASVGGRVAVISEEDGMETPSVAELLARQGHEVEVFHHWDGVAAAVGGYTVGTVLARLETAGVTCHRRLRFAGFEEGNVLLVSSLTGTRRTVAGVDTVVASCGSEPDAQIYRALAGSVEQRFLIGDAWAPRGIHEATEHGMVVGLGL